MARQIDNAARAHAEHNAAQQRQAAFHQPSKVGARDQRAAGPIVGFPTTPADGHKFGPGREDGLSNKTDGHRFGPGKDGGDCAKLP